ncbi:hypothetical protein [Shewanella goraebulensis]|uniref:hypothetical protein n=1 Tax=Shewanella goraebulensis TaxID=3050637 RepID=UPI002549FF38|nr:hypothetical protein [Shewanella goraebulensis]
MRLILISLFCSSFLITGVLQAKETSFNSNNAEFLQQSCRDAVELLDNKGQPGTYAAIHTSMAEAMRAGYCIGVVQQYSKASHSCYSSYGRGNWQGMIKEIASFSIGQDQFNRIMASTLLKRAYCGE